MLKHLIIGSVLLASASSGLGRQSVLLDFSQTQVSQSSDAPVSMDDRLRSAAAELGSEYSSVDADLAAPAYFDDPGPSLTDAIHVPLWMRSGQAGSSFGNPFRRASLPPALPYVAVNCEGYEYRPRAGLSAETEMRRRRYYNMMASAACEAGVPVHLFDALVIQESRYNPAALSPKGARGLTQLMPGTATMIGVSDSWNVMENLRGGARYLKAHLDEFGRYDLALGAYNAGPGRIRQYRGVPPFRETRNYVATILQTVRDGMVRSIGSFENRNGAIARYVVAQRAAHLTAF